MINLEYVAELQATQILICEKALGQLIISPMAKLFKLFPTSSSFVIDFSAQIEKLLTGNFMICFKKKQILFIYLKKIQIFKYSEAKRDPPVFSCPRGRVANAQ